MTAEEIAASRLIIFADGLDVAIDGGGANGVDIRDLHRRFADKAQIGFGWGTNFTNDFMNCAPAEPDALRALSVVCKVLSVNGQPTVKLSDNPGKSFGPPDEVARYRQVFGNEGATALPVRV
jgi:nicotinate phosphoribosyltransferase